MIRGRGTYLCSTALAPARVTFSGVTLTVYFGVDDQKFTGNNNFSVILTSTSVFFFSSGNVQEIDLVGNWNTLFFRFSFNCQGNW